MTLALLAAILLVAHTAETILGFGSTIIALALGVHLLPLEQLLTVLIMLGMVQSSWRIFRDHRHVAWRTLGLTILPAAGLGLLTGMWFRDIADERLLRTVLGGFVVAVAGLELVLVLRGKRNASPLAPAAGLPVLFGGGVFHGLFASGGPLIVYFASRAIPEPAVFRSTLAVLWSVLGLTLIVQLGFEGRLTADAFRTVGTVLPAALAGIALGEHIRVNQRAFQILTYALLLFAGVTLLT